MTSQKIYRIMLIATLIITGLVAGSQPALAQTEQPAQASSKIKREDATGMKFNYICSSRRSRR